MNSNKIFFQRINNEEFFEEVRKSQENNHPTERFMIICYSIAHKILRQSRFFKTTPDWKDEACSQSLIKCCDNFHKFDLSRNSSAYSFFHTTITRAIYDTFSKDYYQWFSHKKEMMRISSCDSENDTYFDEFERKDESDFEPINLPSSRGE